MTIRVLSMLAAMATLCCVSVTRADSMLSTSQRAAILEQGRVAFEAGNTALEAHPDQAAHKFRRAAERWSLLVEEGVVNGPLLYDIGNAWVRAGELGRGIAAYLRSERYIPSDARLADNLAYARTLVSPQFEPDSAEAVFDRLTGWHESWSLGNRILFFGLAWCGLWVILIVRRLGFFRVPAWTGGICGVIAGVFGLSVLMSMMGGSGPVGVLIQDDVIVRKGNAQTYQPQFDEPINGGVEFRVLEQQPVWLHVEFPNGEKGWVPRNAAEVVRTRDRLVAA